MIDRVETLVLGAGISGLSYAHARRSVNADLRVWEATLAPGGWVRTARLDEPLPVRYEAGPESLALGSEHVLEMARSLGIEVVSSPAARTRFLVHRGQVVPVPLSTLGLLRSPLLTLRGKLRLLTEPWRSGRQGLDGSVADFARHRLGEETLQALVDPMIRGIHGGDPSELSLRACFPDLVNLVEKHGSVFKGMRQRRTGAARVGMWKPRGGMQELTDRLAAHLGDCLVLGARARSLSPEAGGWRVRGSKGDVWARQVVLAVPLHAARELLTEVAPEVAPSLKRMREENLVSFLHVYPRHEVGHTLAGFGYLVPSRERLAHLGTLFSSSIDPDCVGDGVVLLRTLLGGAARPDLGDQEDDAIMRTVLAEVRPLLRIRCKPLWWAVERHPGAIPRFDLEQPARQRLLESHLPPGLSVLGNFTEGVGLSSLVRAAHALAQGRSTRADRVPRPR